MEMLSKDFDGWNNKKKETHSGEKQLSFYEREVWWCIVGINVGVEVDGKHEFFLRPSIILRKFNKDMALIVPTTTQAKQNKYYLMVGGDDGKKYNSCLSQIRSISAKRLFRKIGMISEKDYLELADKIIKMVNNSL